VNQHEQSFQGELQGRHGSLSESMGQDVAGDFDLAHDYFAFYYEPLPVEHTECNGDIRVRYLSGMAPLWPLVPTHLVF
jgi:hypothetical protein